MNIYCVQQQVREAEQGCQSGASEQKDGNSRTGPHKRSYAHGKKDKQSGALSETLRKSGSRGGKRTRGGG